MQWYTLYTGVKSEGPPFDNHYQLSGFGHQQGSIHLTLLGPLERLFASPPI